MSNVVADLLSISFTIVLILLTSTFSMALIDEKRRKYFTLLAGIFTVLAVGFMVLFIIGFIFYPEPIV